MTDDQQATVATLIHRLHRQYPMGVTTMGHCPQCEKPSRGGDLCGRCLTAELADLTGEHQAACCLHTAIKDARDNTALLLEGEMP